MTTVTPVIPERPIIFSAPMVRAILAGCKTQTRRLIRPQPPRNEDVIAKSGAPYSWYREADATADRPFRPVGPVWAVREIDRDVVNRGLRCPYGVPGHLLWVRETWAQAVKAGVRVLADGCALVVDASRADQLRCGGNSVVALQAAAAFVDLLRRAMT